jgi:putative effector of murein hydrolase LrgA (UPF0299 family)
MKMAKIKENPTLFVVAIIIFIVIFVLSNFLGQWVGFWLTATIWGVVVVGLIGYLIFRKVRPR